MANVYLKMIDDARNLPRVFEAIGTPKETFTSTAGASPVTGWRVCQYFSGESPSGHTNECHLLVDESGDLWELWRSQHWQEAGTNIYRDRDLSRVTARELHHWDRQGFAFPTIARAFERLI